MCAVYLCARNALLEVEGLVFRVLLRGVMYGMDAQGVMVDTQMGHMWETGTWTEACSIGSSGVKRRPPGFEFLVLELFILVKHGHF